ncbi:hypothetical protein BO78DRAFT_276883, partial [Aspergillus sclerotiicarbonarius CBS 121057]
NPSLNTQHKVLAHFMGYELLHPSINIDPSPSLRIADIGTGTGIWLDRLSSTLPTNQPHHLQGFDISDRQFSKGSKNIHFCLHDATEPFPSEHLNSYDIVHVRLFVFALKEMDLGRVMANVVHLLRPGGYFQWEDADFCYTAPAPAPDKPTPQVREIIDLVTTYAVKAGFSMRVS